MVATIPTSVNYVGDWAFKGYHEAYFFHFSTDIGFV